MGAGARRQYEIKRHGKTRANIRRLIRGNAPDRTSTGSKVMTTEMGTPEQFYEYQHGQTFQTAEGDTPTPPTQYIGNIDLRGEGATEQQFYDWYDAYQYTGLEEPLEKQIDPTFEQGWFRQPTAEEKETLEKGGQTLPGAGYLPKDIQTVVGVGDELALETARDLYEEGTGSEWLQKHEEIAEQEELQDILESNYEANKQTLASERKKAAIRGAESTQAGEASMAAGGFEYSAPATRAATSQYEQSGQTMEDLHTQARQARQEFDLGKKEIKGNIEGLEGDIAGIGVKWQAAQADYLSSLGSLYTNADSQLQNIRLELKNLTDAHLAGKGAGLRGADLSRNIKAIPTRDGVNPWEEKPGAIAPWYFAKKRIGETEKMIDRMKLARESIQQSLVEGESGV